MSETARYSPGLRRLHWLIALLVALGYLLMEQRGLFARGSPARAAMVQSHYWVGMTILLLAAWRLGLRSRASIPAISPAPAAWQAVPAKLTHVALYAFIVAQPLLGLATVWTDGKKVLLPFTNVALPALLAPNEALAHQLEDLHGTVGTIFYWVIGVHVLAALYHHYLRRDDTLKRML